MIITLSLIGISLTLSYSRVLTDMEYHTTRVGMKLSIPLCLNDIACVSRLIFQSVCLLRVL